LSVFGEPGRTIKEWYGSLLDLPFQRFTLLSSGHSLKPFSRETHFTCLSQDSLLLIENVYSQQENGMGKETIVQKPVPFFLPYRVTFGTISAFWESLIIEAVE